MVIILGDFSGYFGFFLGIVDDFLVVANPAAFWLVGVGFGHSDIISHCGASASGRHSEY